MSKRPLWLGADESQPPPPLNAKATRCWDRAMEMCYEDGNVDRLWEYYDALKAQEARGR